MLSKDSLFNFFKKSKKLFLLLGFFVPSLAYGIDLASTLDHWSGIIDVATGVASSLALLYFVWGMSLVVLRAGSGSEADIKKGKDIMFWGLISLFIIFSLWGILGFIQENTIGQSYNNVIRIPTSIR